MEEVQNRIRNHEIYDEVANRERFIDHVLDLMETQNVSRTELARRLNKSRPYITRLLSGSQNLTIESMTKIADAFDQELHLDLQPRVKQPLRKTRNLSKPKQRKNTSSQHVRQLDKVA